MDKDFALAMRQALTHTREQNVWDATRTIRSALAGRTDDDVPNGILPGARKAPRPLSEVVRTLRKGRQTLRPSGLEPGRPPPPIPDGARFLTRSFACPSGERSYKLYLPTRLEERRRGVVVMLHGCLQNPDDFATGTRMNTVAEAYGLLVAYPAQTGAHNPSSCWNWFRPRDQERGAGEPAIISGITRAIASEFDLERDRVFVAGLSAGGAMAAVMGATYPDLYAAVGIHSGLPYACANDVISAFAAMRGQSGPELRETPRAAATSPSRPRTIVFHGSADETVHHSNAVRIVADAHEFDTIDNCRTERGISGGGRAYECSVITAPDGATSIEYWLIEGAGHAWSGGHPDGSHTDPRGPDASREMVRFFLDCKSGGFENG